MAIAYGTSSTSTVVSSASSIGIAIPAMTIGDYAIIWLTIRSAGVSVSSVAAGWTLIGSPYTSGTQTMQAYWHYESVGAAAGTATFGFSGATNATGFPMTFTGAVNAAPSLYYPYGQTASSVRTAMLTSGPAYMATGWDMSNATLSGGLTNQGTISSTNTVRVNNSGSGTRRYGATHEVTSATAGYVEQLLASSPASVGITVVIPDTLPPTDDPRGGDFFRMM